MGAFRVFYKDYNNRKGVFLGILTEAERSLNERSPLALLLKAARLTYGDKVKDKKDIFVVPEGEHMSLSNR